MTAYNDLVHMHHASMEKDSAVVVGSITVAYVAASSWIDHQIVCIIGARVTLYTSTSS